MSRWNKELGCYMSNNEIKLLAAQKHNAARVEAQAYEEDRIMQPEKYKRVVNLASRRKAMTWATISMGMGM